MRDLFVVPVLLVLACRSSPVEQGGGPGGGGQEDGADSYEGVYLTYVVGGDVVPAERGVLRFTVHGSPHDWGGVPVTGLVAPVGGTLRTEEGEGAVDSVGFHDAGLSFMSFDPRPDGMQGSVDSADFTIGGVFAAIPGPVDFYCGSLAAGTGRVLLAASETQVAAVVSAQGSIDAVVGSRGPSGIDVTLNGSRIRGATTIEGDRASGTWHLPNDGDQAWTATAGACPPLPAP